MSKLPLVEQIIKYADKKNISFCTPGHKAGLGFLCTEEGRKLYDKFIEADITEVDGADNLHHPEGVIKEAQKLLRETDLKIINIAERVGFTQIAHFNKTFKKITDTTPLKYKKSL